MAMMETKSVKQQSEIKVWDIFVRVFHWGLVGAFAIAFVTEDDFLRLHVLAGYTIVVLLAIRLIWGFIGTRHARFSTFVRSPRVVLAYLKDRLLLRARRYIGHNPAGGAMILALFVSLFMTLVSGLALLGVEENAGPLAFSLGWAGDQFADVIEETHEFFTNFTLLLILIHVGGVLVESLFHKENLVRAMWTGMKRKSQSNLKEVGE